MSTQPRASKFVSRVGEQLPSVQAALQEGADASDIRSLCLHGNVITHCAGLGGLQALTELNLSANNITTLHGFEPLPALRVLNLASNRLQDLSGLPALPALERLSCAHNSISCLRSLAVLASASSPLDTLDLRNNCIDQLTELAVLAPISRLRELQLSGGSHANGIARAASLAAAVATALPQVCARF
jgi:Leucine-rich repeat (LRR) protein